MARAVASPLRSLLTITTLIVIAKVTLEVVFGYRRYLPPDFTADFLRGREAYFHGPYQWAFYPHIASGPIALVLGTLLVSDRFRLRWPSWHRALGRVHVANVLLLVTPSGLGMSFHAAAGPVGIVSFVCLSLLTATTAALGWRAAVNRRFDEHRRWMWRCYVLLCSAVVIRVLGGFGIVMGITADWWDPASTWVCWVLPLAILECRSGNRQISAVR
jgi:uncharacterized membrane protein